MYLWILDFLSLGAILSAIIVITVRSPIMSVLFLIAVFVNIGCYLTMLGIAYLGLAYLIIYVGAVAILFLFVIMMLNLKMVELQETGKQYTQNLPFALILGFLFAYEFYAASWANELTLPSTSSVSDLFTYFNNFNFINGESINIVTQGIGTLTNYELLLNFFESTHIETIGNGLYSYSMIWLIILSFILLLAMIGPIVLCMNKEVSSA